MTISKDLFLAILSMDAYNRGYGAGIEGLSDLTGTPIGSAVVDLENVSKAAQDANFYAVSYKTTANIGEAGTDNFIPIGTTIVVYRGITDPLQVLNPLGIAVGTSDTIREKLAAAFYDEVVTQLDSNAYDANVILTGHSMGGALAGLMASLYGKEAIIFDNTGFDNAASYIYNKAIQGDDDILDNFYLSADPVSLSSKIRTIALEGEIAGLKAPAKLGVQSRGQVVWVQLEALWLCGPYLADGFV